MSESINKVEQTPESYGPRKRPEILNMMDDAANSMFQQMENLILKNFQIVKFGPYRFIGKSVYARAFFDVYSERMFDYLVANSEGIFERLDGLNEYATNENHNFGLQTWEWFNNEGKQHYDIVCGKSELLGYTVGRFMRAGTPVPDGMNYFDIPEMFVAQGWSSRIDTSENIENLTLKAIDQQTEFRRASHKFIADVLSPDITTNGSGRSVIGYYCACEKLNK